MAWAVLSHSHPSGNRPPANDDEFEAIQAAVRQQFSEFEEDPGSSRTRRSDFGG
jgi:hypothetical protein